MIEDEVRVWKYVLVAKGRCMEWKGVNGCMCSGYEGRSVIEGRVKGVHVHYV